MEKKWAVKYIYSMDGEVIEECAYYETYDKALDAVDAITEREVAEDVIPSQITVIDSSSGKVYMELEWDEEYDQDEEA